MNRKKLSAVVQAVAVAAFVVGCERSPKREAAPPGEPGRPGSLMAETPREAAAPGTAESRCAGNADCDQPTSAQVFAALVAVDYHAAHHPPPAHERLPVQDIKSALDVLGRDRSFGWDARLTYASARLGDAAPILMSDELEAVVVSIKTSTACCAVMTDCKIALAEMAEDTAKTKTWMQGAVWFRLDNVDGAYTEIAKILDPQSWSQVEGSWFQATERQQSKTCPQEEPQVTKASPVCLGGGWCDSVYERFEYEPTTLYGLALTNSLFFKTRLPDETNPVNATRSYRLDYGICKNGSYSGTWRGKEEVTGAVLRNSGCSLAWDTNAIDNGSIEESVVKGVKRLHLESTLCGGAGCQPADLEFLNSVMRTLAIVTRIAVCDRADVQLGECAWPVVCDDEDAIDSGPFGCGLSNSDTHFQCPADAPDCTQ